MNRTLLLTFLFISAISRGQLVVKGYVYDNLTRKPLPNIFLHLLQNNDKWVDVARTDSSGYFRIRLERKEYRPGSRYSIAIDEERFNIATLSVKKDSSYLHTIRLTVNKNFMEEVPGMIYKHCSSISFGYYSPKEPRAMTDLPDSVQTWVENYLVSRVGNNFYKKLVLSSGQVVDLDRLNKIENFKAEYHWEAYSYYLCFCFADTAKGIARYCSVMVMDKHGKIIEHIELPQMAADPAKQNLLSRQEASSIAACLGYFTEKTYVDFQYDPDQDRFTWSFHERSEDEKARTHARKELLLCAHTGKLISMKNDTWPIDVRPLFQSPGFGFSKKN